MTKLIQLSRKVAAAVLSSAMILTASQAPAWANVVAAASSGKAAFSATAVGASIKSPALPSNIGALDQTAGLSLATSLPDSVTPVLSPGLQFVTAEAASQSAEAISAQSARTQAAPAAQAVSKTEESIPSAPTGDAEPTQIKASAGTPSIAASPLKRVFSAIGKALRLKDTSRVFDGSQSAAGGMALIHEDGENDYDIELDPAPEQPGDTGSDRLSWNRVHFPGRGTQPTAMDRLFDSHSVEPGVLPGNPQNAAGVEGALRRLIAENGQDFLGITPDQLETVIAQKVEGKAGLSDTIYVSFRQRYETLSVEGTYLNITVKILNGKAMIVGSSAQLFPSIDLEAFGRLSDQEILVRAFERLGRPTGSVDDINKVGRKIMHIGGKWRSVYLMLSDSKTLMAAVDTNTGETFAWDPRHKMNVDGKAQGRGVEFDPGATGTNLDVMPLAHAEVTTSDGRTFHTDADGYFTLGDVEGPVTLTAKLKGKYANVMDQGSANLTATVVAKPGESVRLLFNPVGADENAVAQVNSYRHVTKVHDWLIAQGVNVDSLHRSIPIKSNMNRDCNAYYTPWSPSLNFFGSSGRCSNTAFDSVVYHEYGHFVDDMLGGIVNGGLSEGWGDILSIYITGTPEIGRGFLKNQKISWIRDARNKYQYRRRDEVHKQGEAWGGFAYKLRMALIASFQAAGLSGEEAAEKGAALASALVIPVFFANVRDIPAAIEAVLMRDVNADGIAPHFKEIAAAAAAHGIELTAPKPGLIAGSSTQRPASGWLSRLAQGVSRIIRG